MQVNQWTIPITVSRIALVKNIIYVRKKERKKEPFMPKKD